MRVATISFVFGVWLLQPQAELPDWNPLVYVLSLLVTIFAFCALGKWSPQFPDLKKRGQGEFLAGQTFASLLFILLLAAVGFSYAAYRADLRLSVSLAA